MSLALDVFMLVSVLRSGVFALDESFTRISSPTVTTDTWLVSKFLFVLLASFSEIIDSSSLLTMNTSLSSSLRARGCDCCCCCGGGGCCGVCGCCLLCVNGAAGETGVDVESPIIIVLWPGGCLPNRDALHSKLSNDG